MSLPMLRAIIPKLPYLLASSASHFLSLNPHSKDWDFRTFLTVTLLRSFMSGSDTKDRYGNPISIEKVQRLANQERELEDDCWKVDCTMPLPVAEDEIRALEGLVDRAVQALAGSELIDVEKARVGKETLTGEWIGWRNVAVRGPHMNPKQGIQIWDAERTYEALLQDIAPFREAVNREGVVLWLHGGAYIVCDPCTHRPIGKLLSKAFGGPVLLPRYRLAPQNPFPQALLDSLISYLYLLYPPPGSLHPAYTADQIFFGGDSAGGGLTLSLVQLLLWLNKPNDDGSKKTIIWGGQIREIPLPKGIMILSGWVDLARCFVEVGKDGKGGASETTCAAGDYIPAPTLAMSTLFGKSPAWPTDPPRTHFYANDSAITHPLVSPIAARSWDGCPPVWLCVGDECLRDSNYYCAHSLVQSAVSLHMEKYTSLPHVFPLLLQHHPCSGRAFQSMGSFIKGHLTASEQPNFQYKRISIHPRTLVEEILDDQVLSLGGLELDDVIEMMKKEVKKWERKLTGRCTQLIMKTVDAKAAETVAKGPKVARL